jgi:hypothetical protein
MQTNKAPAMGKRMRAAIIFVLFGPTASYSLEYEEG